MVRRERHPTPTSCTLPQHFIPSTPLWKTTPNPQFWGPCFPLKPLHATAAPALPMPQQLPCGHTASSLGNPSRIPAPTLQVEELQHSQSRSTLRATHLQQRGSRASPAGGLPPSCSFQDPPGTRSTERCPLARGVGAGVRGGSGDRERAVHGETIQPCPQSRSAPARGAPRDAWRRSGGRAGDRSILCSSSRAGAIRCRRLLNLVFSSERDHAGSPGGRDSPEEGCRREIICLDFPQPRHQSQENPSITACLSFPFAKQPQSTG